MINQNRIVPVEKTDLISLYGLILSQSNSGLAAVEASGIGQFEIASGSGNMIANEPVKTVDFGSGVTSATLFFVPAYDYVGFSVKGAAVETAGDAVDPANGGNLYKAALASGKVTITKVGF